MDAEAEAALARGAEVHDEVFEQIRDRLADQAKNLRTKPANLLFRLGRDILNDLVAAHSVIYRCGLHERLDLGQPLPKICRAAVVLLQGDEVSFDGGVFAALRVYQSVASLLTLLKASPPDDRLVDAAFEFGRADVLMAHSITGIWDVMADAHENAMAAGKLAEARKTGGMATAQYNKMQAKAWKDSVLPYAIKVDVDLPNVTRERIAWEIKNEFGKSVPGLRQITDWLQKEAEQPNGPLQSRARKKGS